MLPNRLPGIQKALTGTISADVRSLAYISLVLKQDIRTSGEILSSTSSPVNLIPLNHCQKQTERVAEGLTVWGWGSLISSHGHSWPKFQGKHRHGQDMVKRVQFFRRKVSSVTSRSAFLSSTCVGNRTEVIMGIKSVTGRMSAAA